MNSELCSFTDPTTVTDETIWQRKPNREDTTVDIVNDFAVYTWAWQLITSISEKSYYPRDDVVFEQQEQSCFPSSMLEKFKDDSSYDFGFSQGTAVCYNGIVKTCVDAAACESN